MRPSKVQLRHLPRAACGAGMCRHIHYTPRADSARLTLVYRRSQRPPKAQLCHLAVVSTAQVGRVCEKSRKEFSCKVTP